MLNRPKCLACGERYINRRGKLCWICYQDPELRAKYPPRFDHTPRTPDAKGESPLPTPIADLVPGSEEKIAAMAERARLRQSLFHPQELKHVTRVDELELDEIPVSRLRELGMHIQER